MQANPEGLNKLNTVLADTGYFMLPVVQIRRNLAA
jgi:hypothetical protein